MQATTTAPTVKLSGASLRYHNNVIFDNLYFSLPGGKCTCLLGPSGVGKTSLLRLLAGLKPQDHVTAFSGNISCDDNLPIQSRVAYMAQTDLLLPWLTVLANVTIGHRLRGDFTVSSAIVDRAKQLLQQLGLGKVLQQYPRYLSGGMRQRVALARTLLEDRSIVLMDEPFSAVDAITRFTLQALASQLLKGRTVLLITHDPAEALRLGDQIYVMTGDPASVGDPIIPARCPPRSLDDSQRLDLEADIRRRLQCTMADNSC